MLEENVKAAEDWEGLPEMDTRLWQEAFDRFWRKRGMPLAIDVRGKPIWCRDSGVVSEQISEQV